MKNKAFTYLLLALVIGLWGYVIYRIFVAVAGEKEQTISSAKLLEQKTEDLNYYKTKDTLTLSLAYRDPIYNSDSGMEDDIAEDISGDYSAIQDYQEYVAPEPEINIQYLGFIENEKNKKRVAIVNIEGKQYMIGNNEQQNEVRVLKINSDNIIIQHKQKTKTIQK